MGLFDYVRCEYPLPGNPPANAAELPFQTKDLTCYMQEYLITADGRLLHEPTENQAAEDHGNFTATIDLYWSNVVGSGPGIYTREGEDAHYLEYRAVFVNGKVSSIKEMENRKEKAAPSSMQRARLPKLPTDEERAERDRRLSESLIGKTIVVWWGGSEPYSANVIAENTRKIVVQHVAESEYHEAGDFEIIDRHQRDNCFFDCIEDGKSHELRRKQDWEAGQKEYEDYISRAK